MSITSYYTHYIILYPLHHVISITSYLINYIRLYPISPFLFLRLASKITHPLFKPPSLADRHPSHRPRQEHRLRERLRCWTTSSNIENSIIYYVFNNQKKHLLHSSVLLGCIWPIHHIYQDFVGGFARLREATQTSCSLRGASLTER